MGAASWGPCPVASESSNRRVLAVVGPDAEIRAAALVRALAARGEQVGVARRPSPSEEALPATRREFVARHGALWASECFWLEWATGVALPADPTVLPDAPTIVVAAPMGMPDTPVPAERTYAPDDLRVECDGFGRPTLVAGVDGLHSRPLRQEGQTALRIGVVGSERHHRQTNPALLARLGDAADRSGVAISPVFLADGQSPAALDGLDGLILPGGADMSQVPVQVAAAALALEADLPTLGLCLGMQTMVTAVLRRECWPDAQLEETDGPGPRRSFVRLRSGDGNAVHRLGEHVLRPVHASLLARALDGEAAIRVNHRFAMGIEARHQNLPDLLLHVGVAEVVDAVEAPGKRFFVGLQGHPELGVDRRLHGLWDAFLTIAAYGPCRSAPSEQFGCTAG